MKKFKRHKDYGFWDQDIRLSKLSRLGDPLEKLNEGIDFEMFRELLEAGLSKEPQGRGGRPPYDYVLMFKILILQRYYNLSDEQVEYQINDRMSFMRFLNLTIADDIPDSRTVWCFREQLTDLNLVEELFCLFTGELKKLNPVPRQRNTQEENRQIKAGEIPESFTKNPHKLALKDTDARWTQKNGMNYFGYKNHAKQDAKSKLITKYTVTDASVHDSRETAALLDENDRDKEFYADSRRKRLSPVRE